MSAPAVASADLAALRAALAGADDPEIVELEARLRRAQLDADVAALDALVDERLLFAGPDGRLATKADDLLAHRSGAVRIREHRPAELRVRRVGADVAVASLLTALVVEVGGGRVEGAFRYTRVWGREGGAWRVVAGHVSAVAPAAPDAPADP